jgi:uncharacterized protein
MKIDIYCHLIPPKVKDIVFKKQKTIKELQTNPALWDLETRFRIMDRYPDVIQVLSMPGATPDELAEPGKGAEMARRINEEMAELIFKYPERFASAIAVLPLTNMDDTLKEIEYAVNELKLRGILLIIPINGKPVDRPEFFPIYEKMCEYNLPIWWHPAKSPKVPDYADEKESKYLIWHTWGLCVETTNSMTRAVFGGVMEKFPKIKIITHHCGAMVPFFAERIVNHYNFSETRNHENFRVGLTEAPIEYFKRFYNDTALLGNTPALMCAHAFFGAEHMLFGTDAPFDSQLGDYGTKRTIAGIEGMDIPAADKKKIFEDNARKLLRLNV